MGNSGTKPWNHALGDVVERPAGFFFSEKMTPLEILAMYFIILCQYVVQISLYLFQINEMNVKVLKPLKCLFKAIETILDSRTIPSSC